MRECFANITKPKRYIQYNDLVFTGTKSIDEQTETKTFKYTKTNRMFSHGSYVANRGETLLVEDNTIHLKIALLTNQWSEEHVQAHYSFIMEQLTTPGKLWAVNTGQELVWCNAYVTSIQDSKKWTVTDDDYLVFEIELDNPSGVWYKADESKVFLEDYSTCDFLEMKASCLGKNRYCCNDQLDCLVPCECCENNCDEMSSMVDFCSMQSNTLFLDDFFELCNSKWRVVYNCEKAKLDGDPSVYYPHAICDSCVNDVLNGQFLSLTTIPTKKWRVAIMGNFKDPVLTINDAKLELAGDYEGVVTLNYLGEIRYATDWDCIEFAYKEVPLTMLRLCAETPQINKGLNLVSLAGVKDGSACVYIDYERTTL